MTVEASPPAAEICASIAQEVIALKLGGAQEPNVNLSLLIAQLCSAPALDAIDALAFAAVARKMLSSVIDEYNLDEVATMDQSQIACLYAFTFICRAIETLEIETWLGAEGFTGEAETIN